MKNFPVQRLSYKEKIANDFAWAKQTINALLTSNTTMSIIGSSHSSEYSRMLSNYQLYNNILNQTDFERECNPLGLEVGQFKDTVQPYNKTPNKIQVLLGEEARRPFPFKTVLVNSDGIKSKLEYKNKLLSEYVESQIRKTIESVSPGYNTEELPTSPFMDPKDIDRYMKTSYLDAREILSSKILQYLWKKLDIADLKNDAFKHGLLSASEIVYVGARNDEPVVQVINPLGFFHHKSSEVKYVQDSMFAGTKTYMTSAELLDQLGDYLTEKDKKRIEDSYTGSITGGNLTNMMEYPDDDNAYQTVADTNVGSYQSQRTKDAFIQDYMVQHIEWRSFRKVGFVETVNEYGDQEMTMVSEDFTIPTDYTVKTINKEFGKKCTYYIWKIGEQAFSLEWKWVPEVWSGIKIGADMFCMIGPKKEQYRSQDNPYSVHLGYHGVIYNGMNAVPISLMDRMKPFQYLYFIVMHKLKRLIAQDNGRIYHFDVSMIDPKLGLEKTMYYLKELNIDIYNSLQNGDQPGWAQRGKHADTSDWSNSQNIMNYVNLLAAIDRQISEVAGITPQREGQMNPAEAVGNAQASVQLSAVITEVYFQTHFKLWEKILTSLIHVAQDVYRDKKTIKQYVLDDLSVATLEIDGDSLTDCEMGIFVSSSIKEQELFEGVKQISQALVSSNKASFSDLIALYKANSVEELQSLVKASEDQVMQMQQQNAEADRQTQIQVQQANAEAILQKTQMEGEYKIKVAEINVFARQQDQDVDNNGIPDPLEVEKFKADLALKNRELDIKEKDVANKAARK